MYSSALSVHPKAASNLPKTCKTFQDPAGFAIAPRNRQGRTGLCREAFANSALYAEAKEGDW